MASSLRRREVSGRRGARFSPPIGKPCACLQLGFSTTRLAGEDRERPSVVKCVYGRDTLLLLIALREEDDCRRRQVQDVGSEIRRYVAALLSRTMTAFPVPDGRDSTLQDSPQTSELALQVVRNEISLEDNLEKSIRRISCFERDLQRLLDAAVSRCVLTTCPETTR